METEYNSYWRSDERETIQEDFQKIVSVLTAHQIALWEYDIPTGRCSFSDDYFQILGLDKLNIHFKDMEESYHFIHPDDLPSYQEEFEKMLKSETKTAQIPYRFVGSRGEVVWVEDHFLSYQRNDYGHPQKLVVYTVNVTAKREKELEIARLAEHNRKIIEALPEFIFIFDDKFFLIDVMMAPGTVLLHPVEVLKGADGRSIYSPQVSELFLKNIHECLEDNQLREIEYPLDVDGRRYYFQARIVPFEDTKVLALIHDISDRVRRSNELIEAKRKAEEADSMKTLFLANMSHEIRTPLNAIVGFSEIVSLTEDENEKKEYLEIIQKNSGLLLQLINDILDLSRIESGRSEMHFGPVSLSALLTEVAKVHRLKIPHAIQLEVILPKEDIIINTDRNRLTQVLSNFMSNAIKNTSEGRIVLGCVVEMEWLKMYVADTGCGIPKEKLPLIFNRFEKLNDFVQGTGLGLPICKGIVERLGGQIEVQSKVGAGSTFSVCLHLDRCSVAKGCSGLAKKILVVDESEIAFLQIDGLLKKDYEMLWARDGEEAIECFLNDKPDFVLINLKLAKLDGVQVIEKMKQVSAAIPVVAIVEHSCYTAKQQAYQAGCDEVVVKPYSLDRLKETVRILLQDA